MINHLIDIFFEANKKEESAEAAVYDVYCFFNITGGSETLLCLHHVKYMATLLENAKQVRLVNNHRWAQLQFSGLRLNLEG